jgi:RNA polymerase sigma-70 factor (ECF subfamily)
MNLYDQLHPALLAHLRVLGLTAEDAEDVVHESFVRLMKHLLERRGDDNVRGWLFRVAYNLSMDVHRSNKRYSYAPSHEAEDTFSAMYEVVDPAPDAESCLIEDETFRRLRSAVLLLTVKQRKCILLRSQGLRYREIASLLGISVQRASSLLRRGTAKLRSSL